MRKIFVSALKDIIFNKNRSLVIILAITMVTMFPIAFINVPYNLENIIIEESIWLL